MRFQVPQFTDIEDKIFGPLSFKQFIYLLGGAGIIVILYALLPLFLVVILGLPMAAFSLALAFYKVNNQPFIKVMENAFYYFFSSKLYLWKKGPSSAPPKAELEAAKEKEKKAPVPVYVPKLTKNKLSDLAWSLDIKEKVAR